MHYTPYDYRKSRNSKRYYFTSKGKRLIRKAVIFIQFEPNAYNLGFGDLLPNAEIDDMAISNNGDISKIFANLYWGFFIKRIN